VTDRIAIDWTCRQPTPYNDVLFSAIAADAGFDLTVHFMEPVLSSHPWITPLGGGFPQRTYRKRFGLDVEVLARIRQPNRFLVAGGWHDATNQLAVLARILGRHPFALWTDAPQMGHRGWAKQALRNSFLSIAFSGASSVMGTGRLALERLATMGCPANKLVNLPYFIDLQQFQPRSHPLPSAPLTFVSSGRLLNRLKGHDLAIRAIARASRTHPEVSMRYRIAGTGPDQQSLLDLARSLGVALELCGWVEPADLAAFYQSGQVLLHPSHHDPYATAVLEAMACGLVVIGSSETGAVVDRIEHGRSGLVHPPGLVEALAEQIEFLCADPGSVVRIATEARKVAERWPVSIGVQTVRDVASAALRAA